MKFKKQISKILWDIPPVVIAVLLALAVNTWKENKSEKSAASESLKAIILEINANEASIKAFREDSFENLQRLEKTLDSMESKKIRVLTDVSLNFSFRILSSSVWETSQIRHISKHHSPGIVRDIAKLYNIQGMINDIWQTQLTKISSTEYNKLETTRAMIEAHTELLEIAVNVSDVYLESKKQLASEFDKVINE